MPTTRARWSSAWRPSWGRSARPRRGIDNVLDTALITAPDKRDPALFAKLDAVAGRVLKDMHFTPALSRHSDPSRIRVDAGSRYASLAAHHDEGLKMDFKAVIRTIPDYPKKGIMFRDITTLLGNPRAFRAAVDQLVQPYAGVRIDKVAGIEARGFILGGAVAHQLSVGFVPVRKKGKLPHTVIGEDYDLEYGKDRVEIHADAVKPGDHVIIVDDLIATGGTCLRRDQAARARRRQGDRLRLRHRPARARRRRQDPRAGQGSDRRWSRSEGTDGCMKLYMSPASPFARKARIIVHELDLERTSRKSPPIRATSAELRRVNPLGKIPALVLDDGSSLIDSPVICEYLDDLGGGKFFPGSICRRPHRALAGADAAGAGRRHRRRRGRAHL